MDDRAGARERFASWRGRSLALVVLLGVAAGCRKGGEPAHGQPPVPVVVAAVEEREMPVSIQAIGTVEPIESVAVKAQVGGILTRVAFEEGGSVETGSLLFEIDPRPFEHDLKEAEARLAKDRALAANAAAQAKRYEVLNQKNFVSKEQYDEARTLAESLDAAAREDEQAVEGKRLELEYAAIRAPISGRTGSLLVRKGNLVKADDSTPLVVVNQLRPIRVKFSVPEKNLPEIRKHAASAKLAVRLRPSGDSAWEAEGFLSFIDNAVDRSTGTVLLKGEFENAEGALWPGQFVEVELVLAVEPHAVAAPAQAIQSSQSGSYAFVVKPDGTVEKRAVTVARPAQPWVVVSSGLVPGEQVVTDGQMRLKAGDRVEAKGGAQPPPAEAAKSR